MPDQTDSSTASWAALHGALERSRALGLLGPGPIDAHIEHSRALAGCVPPPRSCLDLGSGGGVPGLVLTLLWPETHFVLMDAGHRRCDVLREAVELLQHGHRCEVVEGRAEDLGRDTRWRATFDLVVARSFGAPPVTAECGAPFLEMGGILLVSEPPDPGEDRWPAAGLAKVGLVDGGLHEVDGRHARTLVAKTVAPDRYPRRVGVPGKRPLWSSGT